VDVVVDARVVDRVVDTVVEVTAGGVVVDKRVVVDEIPLLRPDVVLDDDETPLLAEVEEPESPEVVAEKIRAAIAAAIFSTAGHVTVSIGIGLAEISDSNTTALIKRADQQLYQAKWSGRNRVAPQARVT
jgi:predicted signal transduction protein with EAL and GGDEF domain